MRLAATTDASWTNSTVAIPLNPHIKFRFSIYSVLYAICYYVCESTVYFYRSQSDCRANVLHDTIWSGELTFLLRHIKLHVHLPCIISCFVHQDLFGKVFPCRTELKLCTSKRLGWGLNLGIYYTRSNITCNALVFFRSWECTTRHTCQQAIFHNLFVCS